MTRVGRMPVMAICVLFMTTPGGAEIVDRIVAIVNEEIITQRELEEKSYPVLLTLPGQPSPEEIEQIRKNVMVELVKNKLVIQAAKQKKIVLDREEVESFIESRMAALEKQYGSDLENVLSEQGFTVGEVEEMTRREAKQELIKQRLLSQAVEAGVVVTDDDIRSQYSTRMFLTLSADDATRALLQLKSGKITFPEAVRQFSSGSGLDENGDMGTYLLGKWAEEIEAEVIKLSGVGDLSGVIPTQAGFAVVQLVDRRLKPLDELPPDDRKKIKDRLFRLKSVAESNAYVSTLWERAHIRFVD